MDGMNYLGCFAVNDCGLGRVNRKVRTEYNRPKIVNTNEPQDRIRLSQPKTKLLLGEAEDGNPLAELSRPIGKAGDRQGARPNSLATTHLQW